MGALTDLGTGDGRKFQAGEYVLLRDKFFSSGHYVRPVPQTGTGHVYVHVVKSNNYERHVGWRSIGKLKPASPTAMKKVLEEKTGLWLPHLYGCY